MLIVEVKTKGDFVPTQSDRATLDQGSMTIGRSSENDLVLSDPTGAISRQHCRIDQMGGNYHLTDMSTNGVFVNAGKEKIGRGNTVVLADGDQISIGHYQLCVQLSGDDEAYRPASQPAAPPLPSDSLTGVFGEDSGVLAGDGELMGSDLLSHEPDPWDVEPAESREEDSFSGFQQIGCEQDSLDPFDTVPQDQIPEDWDRQATPGAPAEERLSSAPFAAEPSGFAPAGTEEAALDGRPEAGSELRAPLRQEGGQGRETARPTGSHGSAGSFEAFLAGAGLAVGEMRSADPEATLRLLGEIYRDVVGGLRALLEARRVVKNELKMSQTIIQQSGNNPLKWSLSDEEAMMSLLDHDQRGRLPPQEAIQEAFDDLNAHQIAMVVGMQRAIVGLMKRFDPKALEERIEATSKVGKLMPGMKSRYWEEFTQLYDEIAREAEEDFDSLFGREFAKAYEEHVHQMTGRSQDLGLRGSGRRRDGKR